MREGKEDNNATEPARNELHSDDYAEDTVMHTEISTDNISGQVASQPIDIIIPDTSLYNDSDSDLMRIMANRIASTSPKEMHEEDSNNIAESFNITEENNTIAEEPGSSNELGVDEVELNFALGFDYAYACSS